MNVVYRKANLNDAYGIAYVSAYSWYETYDELLPKSYLEDRINNINSSVEKTKSFIRNHPDYLVALVDDKIAGICEYEKSSDNKMLDYGRIGALYVLKKYQGYGIGKELFKRAVNGLINIGYNKMYLECMSGNNTINFYRKYDGKIKETIDFPISNVGNVKADIVIYNDLNELYEKLCYIKIKNVRM